MSQAFTDLSNKILVATPYLMQGNIFYQSLIYVVGHTPNGALGLIINRPTNNNKVKTIFNHILESKDLLHIPVFIGGPTEIEKAIVLHSKDYKKNLLLDLEDRLALSSNKKILKDIAEGKGPNKSLFIVGCTTWESEQLEFELANNLWMVLDDIDEELIFMEDADTKWLSALAKLGINYAHFSPLSGSS